MNPQDWTVIAVTGAREWKGQHGDFIDYYCDLDGYEEQVVLTQKPETASPEPGTRLYGHIEYQHRKKRDGEPFTIHKFKKDRRDDESGPPAHTPERQNGSPASSADSGGSLKGAYPNPFDSRSLRIERQHSQEMAIRAIGQFTEANYHQLDAGKVRDVIAEWTDYFMEDLDAYEKARRGQPPEKPKAPEPTLEDKVLAGGGPAELDDSSDIPFAPAVI